MDTRKVLFCPVYRVAGDKIAAVAHAKRKPGYQNERQGALLAQSYEGRKYGTAKKRTLDP